MSEFKPKEHRVIFDSGYKLFDELYDEFASQKRPAAYTCQPHIYQKIMSGKVIFIPLAFKVDLYPVTHQKEQFREWYDRNVMLAWMEMMESEQRVEE